MNGFPPSEQIIKEAQLVILWHIAKNAHLIHLFNQGGGDTATLPELGLREEFSFFTRPHDLLGNVLSQTIHRDKWWNEGISIDQEFCRLTAIEV